MKFKNYKLIKFIPVIASVCLMAQISSSEGRPFIPYNIASGILQNIPSPPAFQPFYFVPHPSQVVPFLPGIPFGGGFPPIPNIPPIPDFSHLPDNYNDSNQEVKIINGKKVLVNQETIKSTGNNGFAVSHFETYQY